VNQIAAKPAASFNAVRVLCSTVAQMFKIKCVGKCGVVERALRGGRRGRLSCLWK
jgi:hypothetical protein